MAVVDVGTAVARTISRLTGFAGKAYTQQIWFKCLSYPGTGAGNGFIGVYQMDAAWGSDTQAPGVEGPFVSAFIQAGDTDNGPESNISAVGPNFTGWQCVFFVVDASGNATIYTATETATPAVFLTFTLPNVTSNLYVGEAGAADNRNGKYAECKVWSVALTGAQVAAEWASLTPVLTSGLFSYWSGANGTTIGQDTSGNGHNWTVVGSGFTTDTDLPNPVLPGSNGLFFGSGTTS